MVLNRVQEGASTRVEGARATGQGTLTIGVAMEVCACASVRVPLAHRLEIRVEDKAARGATRGCLRITVGTGAVKGRQRHDQFLHLLWQSPSASCI